MRTTVAYLRTLTLGTALAAFGGCDVEDGEGLGLDATDDAEDGEDTEDEFRIVGGQVVGTNKYPFMTAMFLGSPRRASFVCGGTLIGRRWVLTAAHCVDWVDAQQLADFRFGVGRRDIRDYTNVNTQRADRVYIHPNYDGRTLSHDVALVRLRHPIDRARAALMGSGQAADWAAPGDLLKTIGFGLTAEGGSLSNRLREVSIPVVGLPECRDAYADLYGPDGVNGTMICAGLDEGGRDACQGDSGSPLLTYKNGRWRVAGVTSWGEGCARPEYPGVYARVPALRGWLDGCIAAPNACGERLL